MLVWRPETGRIDLAEFGFSFAVLCPSHSQLFVGSLIRAGTEFPSKSSLSS
jgi:hypothetical protein